ncbi:hypothetical protein EJ04DRAFT_510706 [Polyplosphaeria fusca]|uniref:Uncharacterized protein n=1 Tax=Polyplosphaeria fusca TaxID=682080 RepID=A0A9P4R1A6_9PLEO|nr:hypothetical protein EJ04DRAFT_510706 [Polyplosphaeria fusca]
MPPPEPSNQATKPESSWLYKLIKRCRSQMDQKACCTAIENRNQPFVQIGVVTTIILSLFLRRKLPSNKLVHGRI